MIIDNNLVFCENKALTDTSVYSKTVDTVAGANLNIGKLFVLFQMEDVAAAGGTSISFDMETSDKQDFSSDVEVIARTPKVLTANATAYAELFKMLWPTKTKRYVRFKLTPEGTFTAGKYSIFCTEGYTSR